MSGFPTRPSGPVYGIDLGTTYSALARVGPDGEPQIVPRLDGSLTLPSVVLFVGDQDYVTGEPARIQARALPDDVCTLAKRRMSDSAWRFVSHGRSWSAPAVSGLILKALVGDAEFSLGQPVKDVVITVPAYFGDEERRATKLAGQYAELNVVDVINEPTAAALAYGFARLDGTGSSPAEEVALVYDLGGGTVDITVVELADRRVAVMAIDGDHELGGADWDEKLALHLSHAFTAAYPDAEDPLDDGDGAQQLLLGAERAKRELTDADATVVHVVHDGRALDVPITRTEFERLTAGLLERTIELTKSAVAAAMRAGVRRIDRILLVGGSSRMPAVAARLSQELGRPAELRDPDLAVAKGAALYGEKRSLERLLIADLVTRGQLPEGSPIDYAAPDDLDAAYRRLSDAFGLSLERVRRMVEVQVLNVVSRAFGVLAIGSSQEPEAFFLVHRNDRLPIAVRRSFGTIRDDQDIVTIRLIEQAGGAESYRPEDNKVIAELSITDIPAGYPAGSQIEVTLEMGFDGMLVVTAQHEGAADRPLTLRIDTGTALSQADVARERAQVARTRHRDA